MNTDSCSGSSLYVYEYYLWPNNWFLSNGAEPAIQNDDGINSTNVALENGFITKLHSTAFTTYLTTQFAGIIREEDADIVGTLADAQDTATREWLEDFNTYLN